MKLKNIHVFITLPRPSIVSLKLPVDFPDTVLSGKASGRFTGHVCFVSQKVFGQLPGQVFGQLKPYLKA